VFLKTILDQVQTLHAVAKGEYRATFGADEILARDRGGRRRLNPTAARQRVAAVSAVALQSLATVERIIRGVADDGFEDRGGVSTSV
jgi:hypothetical protein